MDPSFWGLAEHFGGRAAVTEALQRARDQRARSDGASPLERAAADAELAKLLLLAGLADEAVAAARAAFEARLNAHGPFHDDTTAARSMLMQAHMALDQLDEAEALERAVVAAAEQEGSTDIAVATAMSNLANILELTGRFDEAEALYVRALDRLGERPAVRGVARVGYAVLLSSMGRTEDADRQRARATDELIAALGEDDPTVCHARMNQAIARVTAGKALNAMAAFGKTDERLAAALGPGHPSALFARGVRAMIDAGLGRERGREEAGKVLDALRERLGSEHHQYRRAEGLLVDVIEGNAPCETDSGSEVLIKATRRAESAIKRGEHQRALSILAALREAFEGQDDAEAELIIHRFEVMALLSAGRYDEAQSVLERALALARSLGNQERIADIQATMQELHRDGDPIDRSKEAVRLALQARINAAREQLRERPRRVHPQACLDEIAAAGAEAAQAELWLTAAAAHVILGKIYRQIGKRERGEQELVAARTLADRADDDDVRAKIDALIREG